MARPWDFTDFPAGEILAPTPGDRVVVKAFRRDEPTKTDFAAVECVRRNVCATSENKCDDCALNRFVCPEYCAMYETVWRAVENPARKSDDGERRNERTRKTKKNKETTMENERTQTDAQNLESETAPTPFEPKVGERYRFDGLDGAFVFEPVDAEPRSDEHCLECAFCGLDGADCETCACDAPRRSDGLNVVAVRVADEPNDDEAPETEDAEANRRKAWERKIRELEAAEDECEKMERLAKDIAKSLKKRREKLAAKRREYTRNGSEEYDERDETPLLTLAEQISAQEAAAALESGANVAQTLEAMSRAATQPLQKVDLSNWESAPVAVLENSLPAALYETVAENFQDLGELSAWLDDPERVKIGISAKKVEAIQEAFRRLFEPLERAEEEKAERLAREREERRKADDETDGAPRLTRGEYKEIAETFKAAANVDPETTPPEIDRAWFVDARRRAFKTPGTFTRDDLERTRGVAVWLEARRVAIKAEIDEAIRTVEAAILAGSPPEEIDPATFAKIATKWKSTHTLDRDDAATLRRYFRATEATAPNAA